jgi:hypothetical protein
LEAEKEGAFAHYEEFAAAKDGEEEGEEGEGDAEGDEAAAAAAAVQPPGDRTQSLASQLLAEDRKGKGPEL